MTAPNTRTLPKPTTEAMQLLGETTIADLLGSYEHLLAEKERLFKELLQEGVAVADVTALDWSNFAAWVSVDRRLWLYGLLANEVARL